MTDYASGVLAGAVWTVVAVLVGALIGSVIMFYYLRDREPPATVVPGNTQPVPDYPPVVPLDYAPTGYVGSDISGGGW